MSALFEQGFFVRKPAWHGLGIVLDDYPSREQAMELAGHNWDVLELRSFTEYPNEILANAGQPVNPEGNGRFKVDAAHVSHVRSDTLEVLHKPKDTFERISNSTAYDIAEILFDQGFQYETGILLDGGKQCAITLMLDEPITIDGDDSIVLPFGALSWAHDGSASLRVRSGTIRQVCANTVAASEAEGKRLGTDFTFRHTKNVHERIEDAKQAIHGVRAGLEAFRNVMEELCDINVTPHQRDLFVATIIGDQTGKGLPISMRPDTSDRVKNNIEAERAKILNLFMGPTIPEAHRLTGYGLFQAGTEYFDHLRSYRSEASYIKRTLLTNNPAKTKLNATIRQLVEA